MSRRTDIDMLFSMFPSLDRTVIEMVHENTRNSNFTIDVLLEISRDDHHKKNEVPSTGSSCPGQTDPRFSGFAHTQFPRISSEFDSFSNHHIYGNPSTNSRPGGVGLPDGSSIYPSTNFYLGSQPQTKSPLFLQSQPVSYTAVSQTPFPLSQDKVVQGNQQEKADEELARKLYEDEIRVLFFSSPSPPLSSPFALHFLLCHVLLASPFKILV
eukprot:TRINITY_DN496_c0_g1_i17.p1 TRINITY_DN496_c0_g1~~TRINITY_DN496_c0_g1_i17.p1  ORF type:complete len:212 (+),score=29.73 TRINITY_DN496_c0_g1_i17:158-793(+)